MNSMLPMTFGPQFDLDSLEKQLKILKLRVEEKSVSDVIFDFSDVLWFDIATLLFSISIMNLLKSKNISIKIKLPKKNSEKLIKLPEGIQFSTALQDKIKYEPDKQLLTFKGVMKNEERDELLKLSNDDSYQKAVNALFTKSRKSKARDFLKRWKFFEALKENVDEIRDLIVEDDLQYLDEPLSYYIPREISLPYGGYDILLSTNLVEITSFTKPVMNEKKVSIIEIRNYIENLEKTTVRPVIQSCLGIKDIEIFSKSIVKEALLNTEEHPHATVSLLAMSREGKHLIIAIVDNGKGIPSTLKEVYMEDQKTKASEFSDIELIKYAFDKKIIEYATLPGTTSIRKTDPRYTSEETKRGMGLYYLKEKTLELGGFFKVRSGSACVTFRKADETPEGEEVSFWEGTLIKIYLPLKE